MKYAFLTIMVFMSLHKVFAQSDSLKDHQNFTCFKVDEVTMNCYLEDSDPDLDFNNDGILDKEYPQYELDENTTESDDTGNNNAVIKNKEDSLDQDSTNDYRYENDDGIIQHDLPYKDPKENDVGL